jgi:hypothetical protein
MDNPQVEDGCSSSERSHGGSSSSNWRCYGRNLPKSEVVFFTQIILIYIVCVCSLVNLSLGNKNQLWTILLTSCLGYLMPNPSLKKQHAPTAAALSHVA